MRHIGINDASPRRKSVQDIREDYPYLKPEDIDFAKLYTVAYPKVGRPRARKAAASVNLSPF